MGVVSKRGLGLVGGLWFKGDRGWGRGRRGCVWQGWPQGCLQREVGVSSGEWDLHRGPISPSARASLHSKLISNRKGLWKGLGFSSTATFNTDTLAIASSGRGRGQSWGRARGWVLLGQGRSLAQIRSRLL